MAKDISRKVTIYINDKEVDNTLKSLRAELARLRNAQAKATIGSEEYIRASKGISQITAILDEQKAATNQLADGYQSLSKRLIDAGGALTGVKRIMDLVGLSLGSVQDMVADFATLDDAYAAVIKTTGLTRDEVLKLNESLRSLDTRTSIEQLNQLASEAGKLGISGVDSVAGFVKAADKINVALGDELGEGAMVTIGKLADVYAKSTKELAAASGDIESQMLAIGSAVNSLGAASSANEGHLTDFLSRLGGVASQAGLGADKILGYASALDQSNLSVEKSATALQKFITKLYSQPAAFAEIAHMSASKFQNVLSSDMDAAIKAVLSGLSQQGGMDKLTPIFNDLHISGDGLVTTLATLAASIDKVNEAQAIAAQQLATGKSIEEEFLTVNTTAQAQLEKARNAIHTASAQLGESLYPILLSLTQAGTSGIRLLTSITKNVLTNRAALISIAAAIALVNRQRILHLATKVKEHALDLKKNIVAKAEAAQSVITAAKLRIEAIERLKASAATKAMTKTQTTLNAVMKATPWGLVAAAIASVVTALSILRNKTKDAADEQARLNQEMIENVSLSQKISSNSYKKQYDQLSIIQSFEKRMADFRQEQDRRFTAGEINNLERSRLIRDEEDRYLQNAEAAAQQRYDKIQKHKSDSAWESSREGQKAWKEYYAYLALAAYNNLDEQVSIMQQWEQHNASANSPSSSSPVGNAIPSPGKANDNLDKWKSVASAAEDLIAEFRNKALTGAEEIYASIDVRTNDMLKKIEETVGATKEEKDTLAKTLTDAASAYKKAKLDEYLTKYRDSLEKAAADPSGNELIDKINQVAESLRPYDEKIRQLKADQQALADTDKEAAARIAALIQQYEQLKTALADRAYLAIDTSVDTSDFALTGDRFADDKKYNEYTQAIERSRAAATRLLEVTTDPAQRAELEAQIEDLGLQQQNLDNIYKGFDDFEKKIKKSKALDNFINSFQTFGDKALEIFGSINQILDNISNRELRKQEELKDQNIKLLDDQLSQQLISQETYDQRKAAIDEEYSAKQKEIELEQWRREKWLNASEAAMAAALAILRVWSDAGNGTTAMRAAQTAVVGAATLAQMIAIASAPEPYAHGGYVNADTVFRAGEAGSEWIAPHRLLTDPLTAPVIQSLEDYRRGRVSMAAVNMPAVNAASSYLQDHNIDKQLSLLNSQFSLLSKYLSDPRNRQAVISRRTMETFDANENFLRSRAKL